MKLATILPQSYINLALDDTYHMALAHLIQAEGMDRYTQFFKEQGNRAESYVIMDNGLIEGNARPIMELIDKAAYINANEIVMPDAWQDKNKTLHLLDEAYGVLYHNNIEIGTMAVPQGATYEEWMDCAVRILKDFPITCLGIPKMLISIAGRDGRLKVIKDLWANHAELLVGKGIHLLGCWQTPLELTFIAKAVESQLIPDVRGVDSVIAYNFTRAGLKLNEADRPDNDPIDFKDGQLAIEQNTLLRYNLDFWHDCVDVRKDKPISYI